MKNGQREPDARPVLRYDDRCSMCAAFAETIRGSANHTRLDGGNRGEALEYHDEDGVHTGWEAVVAALEGSGRRWVRGVGRIAGMVVPRSMGRRTYRWVAARRQVLSRVLGPGKQRP